MANVSAIFSSEPREILRARQAVIDAGLGSILADFLARCIDRLEPASVVIERKRVSHRAPVLELVVKDLNTPRFAETVQTINIVREEERSMQGYRLGVCMPTHDRLCWKIYASGLEQYRTWEGSFQVTSSTRRCTHTLDPPVGSQDSTHGIDRVLLARFTGGRRARQISFQRPDEISDTQLDRVLASLDGCEAFSRTPDIPIEDLSVAITHESACLYGTDAINRWVSHNHTDLLNGQPISHLFPLNDIRNELLNRLNQHDTPLSTLGKWVFALRR